MHHDRHAERLKASACQFWTPGAGCRGQGGSVDVGEVDPALFEDRAVLEYARATAAAFRPIPSILAESSLAVASLKGAAEAVLEVN